MKPMKELNNYIMEKYNENKDNFEEFFLSKENQKEFKKLVSKFVVAKVAKDPNAPKKSCTSYIIFANEERVRILKDNPKTPSNEIFSKCGENWKKLSKKKREEYEKKALKDKERYEEEMKNYTPPEKPVSVVVNDTEGSKKEKKKRSKSGYNLFCQDFRTKVKEDASMKIDAKDMFKACSDAWKNLDSDKVEEYNDRAKSLKTDKQEAEINDEKPKKKSTNYNNFCKAKRTELKTSSGLKPAEISSKISELWKSMSDEEKSEW